jgi:hypothetical protein
VIGPRTVRAAPSPCSTSVNGPTSFPWLRCGPRMCNQQPPRRHRRPSPDDGDPYDTSQPAAGGSERRSALEPEPTEVPGPSDLFSLTTR